MCTAIQHPSSPQAALGDKSLGTGMVSSLLGLPLQALRSSVPPHCQPCPWPHCPCQGPPLLWLLLPSKHLHMLL